MTLLIIISLLTTLAYLGYTIKSFGIPWSISETYYLLDHKKKGSGMLFTAWSWLAGITLMIAWLNIDKPYQFLAFFACGALLFVGTAAQFKESLTETVHYVSAGICVAAALLWLLLAGYWIIPLISFMVCMPIAIWDKKWVFWIEVAALSATYLTLLLI